MKIFFVLTAAMIALVPLSLLFPQRAHADTDLESLLRSHYDAINRGDVPAIVTAFADDALLIRGGCTPAIPCMGKAEIQRQAQTETTNKATYSILSSQASGNTVIARVEHSNVNVMNAGLQRVIFNAVVIYTADKISRYTQDLDLSDAQSAVFDNFQRMTNVVNGLLQPLQRGDVATAMQVFAGDAVVEGFGLCAAVPCHDRDAIRRELEREAADHATFTNTGAGSMVAGDVLTSRRQVRSDSVRAAGVDQILLGLTVEAHGSLVTLVRWAPVTTDSQTATFLQALGAPAGTPSQLPRTGDELSRQAVAAVALGVLLSLLGVFAYRSSRQRQRS